MKNAHIICLALFPALAGCGGYQDEGAYNGHYDARTNSRADYSPQAGGAIDNPDYNPNFDVTTEYTPTSTTTTTTTYHYTRPGYYDYNGYYIARDSGPDVSPDLFPPRGMCRIWFPDREVLNQPPVEACNGIQSRVPSGAYVIYGG